MMWFFFGLIKESSIPSHEDVSLCNYLHALEFSFHSYDIYPTENKFLIYVVWGTALISYMFFHIDKYLNIYWKDTSTGRKCHRGLMLRAHVGTDLFPGPILFHLVSLWTSIVLPWLSYFIIMLQMW